MAVSPWRLMFPVMCPLGLGSRLWKAHFAPDIISILALSSQLYVKTLEGHVVVGGSGTVMVDPCEASSSDKDIGPCPLGMLWYVFPDIGLLWSWLDSPCSG
ncbi:hypothetical protein GOP47_0030649 [Adiantum capillus-veneris]|nr:hypothetical protein GOP47_0030649 [Adiantum capillus-veneris]